ncbi:MAG: hypothetical protein ACXVKQ_06290 [Acidimicrobiia bacterium]
MRRSVLGTLVAVILLGGVAAGIPAATAKAMPKPHQQVLLDTMVNDQVNPCGTRPIDGGTTNGYLKDAASLAVSQPAKISSVVLPLTVVGTPPATIQVTVVASKPFPGESTGSSAFWDRIPDETIQLGRTTAKVTVAWAACGQPQIVTARFKKAVIVKPGTTYWVVAQNPGRKTKSFQWNISSSSSTASTNAIYVADSNGSRWLSYPPEMFPPNGIRVIGTIR